MDKSCLVFIYVVHILVWIFIIFGGFISKNTCKSILFVFVPAIYIIHTLPFHVLLKKKLEMINNNLESFGEVDRDVDPKLVVELMKSGPQDITKERQLAIAKVYFAEEDKFIVPEIYGKICTLFSDSFANPLSPQGMLILAMIVNVYLLHFYWRA